MALKILLILNDVSCSRNTEIFFLLLIYLIVFSHFLFALCRQTLLGSKKTFLLCIFGLLTQISSKRLLSSIKDKLGLTFNKELIKETLATLKSKANELTFSVDFVKAVGIKGYVQGSYGTDVDVSEDGNTIIVSEYTVETESRGKTCYIDIPSLTYEYGAYEPLENSFDKENIKGSVYPGVKISQIKYMLNGKEWILFK